MADAEAALRGATLKDWGRLLAGLLRRYRRPGLVEDVLAEAFAPAARAWTPGEIPANPTGWLQTAADRCIYLAFTAWYAPGGDALVRIQDTVEAVRRSYVTASAVKAYRSGGTWKYEMVTTEVFNNLVMFTIPN